jgi:hypothetical protein
MAIAGIMDGEHHERPPQRLLGTERQSCVATVARSGRVEFEGDAERSEVTNLTGEIGAQ